MTKKRIENKTNKLCKNCVFSYDWHNLNYLGELIMGKCKHYPYSVLLSGSCKVKKYQKK